MKVAAILILFFICPAVGFAKWYCVPDGFPTIQDAIDYSISGDLILVKPGIYVENIDFLGKNLTVRSDEDGNPFTYDIRPELTVIDGAKKSSVVIFFNGESADAVLDGFTLINGKNKIGIPGTRGGGIWSFQSSPTVKHNIITNNIGESGGGGITCEGGGVYTSPTISHNTITNNTGCAFGGGGICCIDSNPTITHNIIMENDADYGGGIWFSAYSSPEITNNIISNNEAAFNGGGIYSSFMSSAIITNCTIAHNSANVFGGGGIYYASGNHTIINTILWNNDAPMGPEIWLTGVTIPTTSLEISYSDVKGGQNSVLVDSGCILKWGMGMIDKDPFFVDPSNGDFHILYKSGCRGKAYNSAPNLPVTDIDGDPHLSNSNKYVDIGADKFYTHLYIIGDATPGGYVELKFIGKSGGMPVWLFLGSGVLKDPIKTTWGEWWSDWWLAFPISQVYLGLMPKEGVKVISGYLPFIPPGPYTVFMQGYIVLDLTNLCLLSVR